jgi:hypothetical protein
MNPRYPQVAARAEHRCEYCRAPEAIFNFPFEVEHIVSSRHNGADIETNWALACRSCNVFKSDRIEAVDPGTGELARLFHPRLQAWDEHFELDAQRGAIVGTTPTGRATAAAMRMNHSTQIEARRQWIQLGLYP